MISPVLFLSHRPFPFCSTAPPFVLLFVAAAACFLLAVRFSSAMCSAPCGGGASIPTYLSSFVVVASVHRRGGGHCIATTREARPRGALAWRASPRRGLAAAFRLVWRAPRAPRRARGEVDTSRAPRMSASPVSSPRACAGIRRAVRLPWRSPPQPPSPPSPGRRRWSARRQSSLRALPSSPPRRRRRRRRRRRHAPPEGAVAPRCGRGRRRSTRAASSCHCARSAGRPRRSSTRARPLRRRACATRCAAARRAPRGRRRRARMSRPSAWCGRSAPP